MHLVIDPHGSVRAVYSELIDFHTLGRLTITRASHVEPGPGGVWHADLSPVSGPRLGPFGRRSEALDAELAWLEANPLMAPPEFPLRSDRREGWPGPCHRPSPRCQPDGDVPELCPV